MSKLTGIASQETLSDDEALFIGQNVDYHYRRSFTALRESRSAVSWNWSAFLFAPFWLFYRKMYVLGAVCILTVFLQWYLMAVAPFCVTLTASAILGLFGDRLYLCHVCSKISRINKKQSQDRKALLIKRGGVSVIACALTPVWPLLVIFIFFLILQATSGYSEPISTL